MDQVALVVDTMDSRAEAAAVDRSEAERLIEEYQPYLRRCAGRYANAKLNNHDELFSHAMVAFYEAITSYDRSKGHFFPFADRVVRRRIIDCVRKLYRAGPGTLPLVDEDAGGPQSEVMARAAHKRHAELQRQSALAAEIEQFTNELQDWSISMQALVKQSPRHARLRHTYHRVIAQIADDLEIVQTIRLKKYFPIKKVGALAEVPQKKLERGRIYILACLLIHLGDYEYLSDYIDYK